MKNFILLSIVVVLFSCKSEKQKLAEQIQLNEQKLFNDTSKMLNPAIANEELIAYKKFVSKFPQDTASPVYLYRAADLAHGLRHNREALDLYKQFVNSYPDNAKAASCLFLQAFIYDSDLQQKDSAKILYGQFLDKYPNHNLASSARASLEQIEMGLSDEELIKLFEARRDSAEKIL